MSRPAVDLAAADRVSVTTAMDNYVDGLRPDEKIARRLTRFRARKIADLRAEHGLAQYVEVARGRDTTRVALDFGLTATALNHNLHELRLDPSGLDALVLSHGHLDHWGGLPGFLGAYRRSMRRDLRLYAGEGHFLPRWSVAGDDRIYMGTLHRGDIERHDVEVVTVKRPHRLADTVLLSGEMHERLDFETLPASLQVETEHGVVPDDFIGEQSLVVHVRDRGLVVVTSCSHRGVIGICRHAVRLTGVEKIHAVIGGFHLSGQGGERIDTVVEELGRLGVDWVVPQHCTGFEAQVEIARRMPRQFVLPTVGTTFVFATTA